MLISRGCSLLREDKAAATPAACPVAIEVPGTRVDPWATCVVDMALPATSNPSIFLGTRQRYGIP